jgi:hypothetical protein
MSRITLRVLYLIIRKRPCNAWETDQTCMYLKEQYSGFYGDRGGQWNRPGRTDWLIDYFLFYVPLKNISLAWRRHHYRWRAAKFRPMLGAQGLWAGRDLYRVTPAVTRGLGFSGIIRKTAPFSRLLRHTRGCGGCILTRRRNNQVYVHNYVFYAENTCVSRNDFIVGEWYELNLSSSFYVCNTDDLNIVICVVWIILAVNSLENGKRR